MQGDYPTHEEVRWWTRNHANFPWDFHKVRRAYEDYKRKQGRTDNETRDIGNGKMENDCRV